jgi:hypothetical protein
MVFVQLGTLSILVKSAPQFFLICARFWALDNVGGPVCVVLRNRFVRQIIGRQDMFCMQCRESSGHMALLEHRALAD